MKRLIDPPDVFSGTLQDWRDFLAEMERIELKDDDVREAIQNAKNVIQDREGSSV